MQRVGLVLIGVVLGTILTVAVVILTGDWYEYHLYHGGDPSVIAMVNDQGWEITLRSDELLQLRRPRFRLH